MFEFSGNDYFIGTKNKLKNEQITASSSIRNRQLQIFPDGTTCVDENLENRLHPNDAKKLYKALKKIFE